MLGWRPCNASLLRCVLQKRLKAVSIGCKVMAFPACIGIRAGGVTHGRTSGRGGGEGGRDEDRSTGGSQGSMQRPPIGRGSSQLAVRTRSITRGQLAAGSSGDHTSHAAHQRSNSVSSSSKLVSMAAGSELDATAIWGHLDQVWADTVADLRDLPQSADPDVDAQLSALEQISGSEWARDLATRLHFALRQDEQLTCHAHDA